MNLSDLGSGCIYEISKYLRKKDIYNLRLTCKYINNVRMKIYFVVYYRHICNKNINCNFKNIRIDNDIDHDLLKLYPIEYNITHLDMGFEFNQPLNNIVPKSVIYLKLSYCFNQVISVGEIPNSVKYLYFGAYFNTVLEPGSIPDSVTHLSLGSKYYHLIKPGCIPNSVTHFTFYENLYVKCANINLSNIFNFIPTSVIYLKVVNDRDIHFKFNKEYFKHLVNLIKIDVEKAWLTKSKKEIDLFT